MTAPPIPLFERLPEIHRTRDAELETPGQLKAYLGLIDEAFLAIHTDIWRLYDDLFVESATDWAVPYIGDLLGTSHLDGDPWTIRADVADTIALRRRKGTLAAIEILTFDLTGWGVHCVELREILVWNQHLNHLRPDLGEGVGVEPPGPGLAAPRRGGTVTVRDPAILSLLGTPFDPFAHLADVRPMTEGAIRYNLPNLAIFLWRLSPQTVRVSPPGTIAVSSPTGGGAGAAPRVVRIEIDPIDRPVRLFNAGRAARNKRLACCEPDDPDVSSLSDLDQAPGPILPARLTDDTPAGAPKAYVAVETYDPADLGTLNVLRVGLQLHLPDTPFANDTWQFRGANLCAWEDGLDAPLLDREIAIDPIIGRLAVGVATAAEATAIRRDLLLSYTTGSVGPVGAQPIDRVPSPRSWMGARFDHRSVDFRSSPTSLQAALAGLDTIRRPVIIDIEDSFVHDLDLSAVAGTVVEDGGPNLTPNRTVVIRAADGERPIIRLAQPLRVRPARVVAANPAEQDDLDAENAGLGLRLEGLFVCRGPAFPAGQPLVARVALDRLEIDGCTLDPGGFRQRDGTRAPLLPAAGLGAGHGFAKAAEATAFRETPRIIVRRSIVGSIQADDDYAIDVSDAIVDAGSGPADQGIARAVGAASDPVNGWGAPLTVSGATFLGSVRVERVDGTGGIWTGPLEAHDDQTGCISLSYVEGLTDRLPQNVECVRGTDARLRFVSIDVGHPAYGQLARTTDFRILERGPGDDEMGAFGFLREAHKWRNLQIRYREFMPLGVRPLLIPAT